MNQTYLSLRSVSKRYNNNALEQTILDDCDFSVDRGKFVAVGGPSGSGKSTLLNIIAGIDRADSGEVWVGNQLVNKLSEKQITLFRRHHVGFVFQFFNLISTLTVLENLQLPVALCNLPGRDDQIRQWLQEFGLSAQENAYPDTLSGGEQQRVAVLRAAVHQPGLIIADEPTGNLDRDRGDDVLRLLRRFVDSGSTVLMATHSRHAAGYADHKYYLQQGKLISWDW